MTARTQRYWAATLDVTRILVRDTADKELVTLQQPGHVEGRLGGTLLERILVGLRSP